jgi:ATP-binding cassette, subfamily B, bacterial MsbA
MDLSPKSWHRRCAEYSTLGMRRGEVAWLLMLTVGFAFFEGMGITMILPILEVAESGRAAASVGSTTFLGQISRRLHLESPHSILFLLMMVALMAIVVRSVLQYCRDCRAADLKFRVAGNLRKRAITAFMHTDMHFFAAHNRGELMNTLILESDRAAEAIATRIVFVNAAVLFFVYLTLLFVLSPWLALYALPVFVGVGYLFRRQGRLVTALSSSVYLKNKGFAEQVSDAFNCLVRIKMRALEAEAARRLGLDVGKIMADLFSIERLRIFVEVGVYPLLVGGVFAILYIAIIQLRVSLAELGVFMFVMVRLVPQLTLMNSLWAHMHGYAASYDNLEKLIAEAGGRRELTAGGRVFSRLEKEIVFDRVSFSYSGIHKKGKFGLKEVSFSLPKASMTAIVGRSGAGKTTILNLLAGFYSSRQGEITIDGTRLQDYHLQRLRRKIAYVTQQPLLFQDTLRNNLNFGLEQKLTDTRMQDVLRQAHCLDIMGVLDNGLDTHLGEYGGNLSLGQCQRLALAVGLAIEPDILLLDEPTSSLDALSEKAIQQTIGELKRKLTIVVVAHRLSTIAMADQILLFDGGRLVCAGSHQQLFNDSALYRALFTTELIVASDWNDAV